MRDYQSGAPFTVLRRDIWLIDPPSMRDAPGIQTVGRRLIARRLFGLDQDAKVGFQVFTVPGPVDWAHELPRATDTTLYVLLDAPEPIKGGWALFAGWCAQPGPPAPISSLRSPESFRMLFASLIPTYSPAYRRECWDRWRVRRRATRG